MGKSNTVFSQIEARASAYIRDRPLLIYKPSLARGMQEIALSYAMLQCALCAFYPALDAIKQMGGLSPASIRDWPLIFYSLHYPRPLNETGVYLRLGL